MASSTTVHRVSDHTDETVNRQILEGIADRIRHYAANRDQIGDRLQQLDREWDIERVLEANAALFGFTGVVLAASGARIGLRLAGLVTGFLFLHAVQGWCPPVPVLRRLGVRTPREIEVERVALKALRGDFEGLAAHPLDDVIAARRALEAARR
jgi:hypothetical protein